MKKATFLLLIFLATLSCKDDKTTYAETAVTAQSRMNHVVVVIENEDWTGTIGDAIRNALADPFLGVINEEPAFSLNQIQPKNFNGFATKSRNIVIVDKDKPKGHAHKKNVYARPQSVFYFAGTQEDVISEIEANAEKIKQLISKNEITEKGRQIANSTLSEDKSLEENLGIKMNLPAIYKTAREEDNFLWIERPTPNGTMNILAYAVPAGTITNDSTQVQSIIDTRDKIGRKYVHGRLEGSYMVTENVFAPYVKEEIIDNKPALEARGRWDLKNGFMAGPFVNYIIEDEVNERQVVVEGFVFAPQKNKRDLLFELEAILRSTKIL